MSSDALCQLGIVSVRLNASQTETTYRHRDLSLSDMVMKSHLAPRHAWPGRSLVMACGRRVSWALPLPSSCAPVRQRALCRACRSSVLPRQHRGTPCSELVSAAGNRHPQSAFAPPGGLKAMRCVMPAGRLPGRAIAAYRTHPARQYLSVLRAQRHP